MWAGKVDVEDWRVSMETVNVGSLERAERIWGPKLPPAWSGAMVSAQGRIERWERLQTPMMIMFLIDILNKSYNLDEIVREGKAGLKRRR